MGRRGRVGWGRMGQQILGSIFHVIIKDTRYRMGNRCAACFECFYLLLNVLFHFQSGEKLNYSHGNFCCHFHSVEAPVNDETKAQRHQLVSLLDILSISIEVCVNEAQKSTCRKSFRCTIRNVLPLCNALGKCWNEDFEVFVCFQSFTVGSLRR